MAIINLTRTNIPKTVSKVARQNIDTASSMPEFVLSRKVARGDKSIAKCEMGSAIAEEISSNGVTTVYTDGLAGCNAINVVAKLNNNRFLSVLSHFAPVFVNEQVATIAKLLSANANRVNKNYEPYVFMNLRGMNKGNGLEIIPNPIIAKMQEMLEKIFPQGVKIDVTPYQLSKRPEFFSSANVFQFDPKKISTLKVTNVGEQEKFIDLNI